MNSARILASLNCRHQSARQRRRYHFHPTLGKQTPPTVSLVWADAATPDTLLTHSQSQIAHFAHRALPGVRCRLGAARPPADHAAVISTYLAGYPYESVLTLADQKVTLKIRPRRVTLFPSAPRAMTNPPVGENDGWRQYHVNGHHQRLRRNVVGNIPFVIKRKDAENRQVW